MRVNRPVRRLFDVAYFGIGVVLFIVVLTYGTIW